MQPKKASTSLFQVGLLIVLSAIAIGIWRQKLTPPAVVPDSAPPYAELPQFSPPARSAAPNDAALPPDTPLPPPQSLVDSLKNNDLKRLKQICDLARTQRKPRFLFDLFLLAMEHGSSDAIKVIGLVDMPLDAQDFAAVKSSFKKMLEQDDSEVLRTVLQMSYRFGIDTAFKKELLLDEFSREPWDQARFEKACNVLAGDYRSVMSELVTRSLDGTEERWRWLVAKLKALHSQGKPYASEVERAVNTQGLATATNIDRLLAFLPFLQSGKVSFLVYNQPFLDSEHFDSVLEGLKGESFPAPLVDYALRQDAEKIVQSMKRDASFYRQIQSRWNETILNNGKSLDNLLPIAKHVLEFAKNDPGWTSFGPWQAESADKYIALWKEGFRPSEQTAVLTRLFLALRFRDADLLRQTMQSSSSELNNCLNLGFAVGPKQSGPSSNTLFVPLLEAIRDWNLEAVTLLTPANTYDWRNWRHTNPIALAAEHRKPEICVYLAEIGVPFNKQAEAAVASLDSSASTQVLANVAEQNAEQAGRLAPQLALQAARTGDFERLEAVLPYIPFRSRASSVPAEAPATVVMHLLESYSRDWKALSEINETVLAAIAHPHLFARLQFEGFPIGASVVEAIMESGQNETLEIALSDMATRQECERLTLQILRKAKDHPYMARLYRELGMLDNIEPAVRASVANAYQEITGQELETE